MRLTNGLLAISLAEFAKVASPAAQPEILRLAQGLTTYRFSPIRQDSALEILGMPREFLPEQVYPMKDLDSVADRKAMTDALNDWHELSRSPYSTPLHRAVAAGRLARAAARVSELSVREADLAIDRKLVDNGGVPHGIFSTLPDNRQGRPRLLRPVIQVSQQEGDSK